MASIITATTTSGLTQSADNSGVLQLASGVGNLVTVPAGTGTAVVNGINSSIVSGTAVASTSGTSIDFTGIPSWVKRVTVVLSGVSINGGSIILVQIGNTTVTTSGYSSFFSTNGLGGTTTQGFYTSYRGDAANALRGNIVITNISTNNYVAMGVAGGGDAPDVTSSSGSVALGGVLDRVRITTANGTDTFDAGSINILYE